MNENYNKINSNIISFKNKINKENQISNYINTDNNNINYNDYSIDYKKYSELCEKRIKQLNPNQAFPITKEDLSKNNCLSSMEIRFQLKENQLMKMENEIKDLKNKCLILEEKNKQMVESREKILKTLKEQKNLLIFPPPERIPCEKLYEGYSKLYEAFNKVSNDKEVAVVSLQNEILINDHQRNYIEILKQTLESNLLKNGIKSQVEIYNKIQKKKNSEEFINNIDNICEGYEELFNIVGLNKKIEDLYKQNNILELENNKLKSEIKDLNNRNNIFREQINNSLKNGINELEQAKFKIKELESEKEKLIEENNLIKKYNDKNKFQFGSFQPDNLNNSKRIKYKNNNNDEINEYINKFESIQEEYQILKNNFVNLQNDNEILLKENEEQKEQISIFKQENEALIKEISNMKDDYNKTKNNQFQSFSNNNFEDTNNRNSLNSISIKANASNLTGRRYFENTNNEFYSNSNFNNNINSNQNWNNLNNTNNNNYQLINNEMEELKQYIYNCLLNSNEFIKFCFSKYKENESIEEELKENEIWNNFINSLTSLSQLFQECYNLLDKISNNNNSIKNNINNSPKHKISTNNISSTKAKTQDDTTPIKMTLSITNNDSFNNSNAKIDNINNKTKSINEAINNVNIDNNNNLNIQELLIELEKYKEDNKIIYKNYKKLENENVELFFVNKENKFYYKLISRILQYHINNINAKTIINKLVIINGKAISLDMEKNKIKIKIDDISCSLSSTNFAFNNLGVNSKYFYDNQLCNSEELDKLKKMFSTMEKELNEKYLILKSLDKELKVFESRE